MAFPFSTNLLSIPYTGYTVILPVVYICCAGTIVLMPLTVRKLYSHFAVVYVCCAGTIVLMPLIPPFLLT